MINLLIRTLLIYFAVIFVLRLMGKRQIGQLQPFEMVITIIIADLAAMPMQDEKIPLLRGVLPLIVLLLAQALFSLFVFKNKTFRSIINGKSLVLIANGEINHSAVQKSLISFSDIVEAMHEKGISDFGMIDFAILETNGRISIFPKAEHMALEKSDIPTAKTDSKMSIPVVMNGKIMTNYILFTNETERTLCRRLRKNNTLIEDVLFGYIDSNGKLQYITRKKKK